MMKAGDLLVNTLVSHGVKIAFTVPGESFLTVLEALRRNKNLIRLISCRHESGGGFMAEAYGKLTGEPAPLFVSRGPGATNASVAIHTARQDSTPLILFIGQVRRNSLGKESFQEIDHHAMFAPIAKTTMEPNTPNDIGTVTSEAITVSKSGRPGPVVVVIPRDVTEAEIVGPLPLAVVPSSKITEANIQSLKDASILIENANKPLAIAGEQAAHEKTFSLLGSFAEKSGVPVMAAYRRQDTIDNLHIGYAGHLDINRPNYQRKAIEESDLIIAIGSRLDGITSEDGNLISGRKLVMIYPDREVLERHPCNIAINANIRETLIALMPFLGKPKKSFISRQTNLHESYLQFSKSENVTVKGNVNLATITKIVAEMLPKQSVVLTDGGSFARWIHRFYRLRCPKSQIGPMSGAMGYAVPGAIGASIARPNIPIIGFVGDGGFMMTGQELATAVYEKINLVILICDNGVHGSILQGQIATYGKGHAYATQMKGPDFCSLARGYGAWAIQVNRTKDFAKAFSKSLLYEGPAVIHLVTDQRDIVPFNNEKEVV